MKYECKYLVGDIGAKAAELWEEYPEVMDAVGMESVQAWRTGYRQGFMRTFIPTTIGGIVVGVTAFAGYLIWRHKQVPKTEVDFEEF